MRKAVRRRQLALEAAEEPGSDPREFAELVAFQPAPAPDG